MSETRQSDAMPISNDFSKSVILEMAKNGSMDAKGIHGSENTIGKFTTKPTVSLGWIFKAIVAVVAFMAIAAAVWMPTLPSPFGALTSVGNAENLCTTFDMSFAVLNVDNTTCTVYGVSKCSSFEKAMSPSGALSKTVEPTMYTTCTWNFTELGAVAFPSHSSAQGHMTRHYVITSRASIKTIPETTFARFWNVMGLGKEFGSYFVTKERTGQGTATGVFNMQVG